MSSRSSKEALHRVIDQAIQPYEGEPVYGPGEVAIDNGAYIILAMSLDTPPAAITATLSFTE